MTKILALMDVWRNLAGFHLLPGQRHDICGVEPSIRDRECGALLADKAFDADWLVGDLTEWLSRRAATANGSVSMTRKCISGSIWLMKAFRKVAMRAEKTDSSFPPAFIWLPLIALQ